MVMVMMMTWMVASVMTEIMTNDEDHGVDDGDVDVAGWR